jgi:hypothetical protein
MKKDEIDMKLSEYRMRQTGKDPFGPYSDLKYLFSILKEDENKILLSILNERREDPFWKTFIDMFLNDIKLK